MNLDNKWYEVQARMPEDGRLVAIKLIDRQGNIHYGIGRYDARASQWVVTARPQHGGSLEEVAWHPLPD